MITAHCYPPEQNKKGRGLLRLQAPHRLTPDGTQPGEADPCYRPA